MNNVLLYRNFFFLTLKMFIGFQHSCTRRMIRLHLYSYKVLSINVCVVFLLQNENLSSRRGGNTTTWDSGIGGLSSTSNIVTQLEGEEDIRI